MLDKFFEVPCGNRDLQNVWGVRQRLDLGIGLNLPNAQVLANKAVVGCHHGFLECGGCGQGFTMFGVECELV